MAIQPVILAGGVGSRLTPLSTESRPKQFLALLSPEPMIQMATRRAEQFGGTAKIIGREMHLELLQQHCADRQLILQPGDRGTGAGVALAALASSSDDILIVLPSDHVFASESALRSALECAVEGADQGEFVCFGVVPTDPDPSFGYLAGDGSEAQRSRLSGFIEKPSIRRAHLLIEQGWMWNSGMFVVQAGVFLEQARVFEPKMMESIERSLSEGLLNHEILRPQAEVFMDAPWVSVDRGIMERTEVSTVVRLDAGWNDVGTWPRLWEASGLVDGQRLQLPPLAPGWLGEHPVTDDITLISNPSATYLVKRASY